VALAICVQAIDASWERFGRGILQTGGSFGSQNLLGVLSHFIVFPAFALTLAIRRDKFFLIATAASTLIAILTTSRATVALTALGMSLVLMLSAMRGWTRRKTSIFAAGFIALVIFVPLGISSFDTRFETQKITDIFADTSRIYMENAAKAIIANHPMGVGPNQYIVFANTHGYNQAAHVDWVNMRTNVHNSYLLIAAESGYLGLLTFVCMILPPIFLAFRYGFKVARSDLRGDILIGVGVSLLMLYLHAYYEWLFVTSQVQYLFAISLGIVSGLTRQLREHSTILASKEMIPSFTYIGRPNR
jgi:O-antigen ligase